MYHVIPIIVSFFLEFRWKTNTFKSDLCNSTFCLLQTKTKKKNTVTEVCLSNEKIVFVFHRISRS